MDAEQEATAYAVRLFLSVTCVMLIAMLLELVWGAQWRWLATTAIVGVAVAVAVPIVDVVRTRPHGLLSPPEQGTPVLAGDWKDPETFRAAKRAIDDEVALGRKPFPIPVQPINPPTWAPGQPRPVDEFFAADAESAAEIVRAVVPVPPPQLSPVDDPPDATARFPRPDTR